MWYRTPSTWYAQQNDRGAWPWLKGMRLTLAGRYFRPPREWLPRLARRFVTRFEPGVTIVIAAYNAIDYLPTTIDMIRRYSDEAVRILVVDDVSTDGTREWIIEQGLDSILLPQNLGHGGAMNLGWLSSRTQYTVALDADAFPISHEWLERVIEPLTHGHRVSGAFQDRPWGYGRAFVHPCWLAMETARFFKRGHTFQMAYNWDTGELISWREYPGLHLIGMSSLRGPGWLGQVFGELVYHNGYSTIDARLTTGEQGALFDSGDAANIDGIAPGEQLRAWQSAVAEYGDTSKKPTRLGSAS